MNLRELVKMREQEGSHWWYLGKRMIISSIVTKKILPLVGANPRILDIGCGTGYILDTLSDISTSLFGIDISSEALEMSSVKEKAHLVVGDASESKLPFRMHNFDLVILNDILEHVEDDRSLLSTAKDNIAHGGRILLTAPACRHLFGSHDRSLSHFRRYSKNDLVKLLQYCDVEIEFLSFFNTFLFPPIAAFRIIKNALLNFDDESSAEELSDFHFESGRLLNTFLARIFSAEVPILGRMSMPFGVSLLCVGKTRE